MCGEKCDGMQEIAGLSGSPPHVRGKGFYRVTSDAAGGITPACAGKRAHSSKEDSHHEDHPRMCGEKFYSRCPLICYLGSPPHVRGKD